MVVTSEDDSIFLISFDSSTYELTFRSSRNPEYLQTEKVVLKEGLIYTNLHHFPLGFLQRVTI